MARPRDISKDIEALARDICWAEFTGIETLGTTKAAYWRGIHEDARGRFRDEARRFSWLMRKLGFRPVLEIVGFSCSASDQSKER